MKQLFDADFFIRNRQKLRQNLQTSDLIIVTANGLLQRSSDGSFPFQQDSNFWYLTGINQPDIILVIEDKNEYLIVPDQTDSQKVFDGAIDNSELTNVSGITAVMAAKDGWKRLRSKLRGTKSVSTLGALPAYIESFGLYANPSRGQLIEKLKRINASLRIKDIRLELGRLRMIKQLPELAALQAAINTTITSINEVKTLLQKGSYSYGYELEADLSRGFRRRGASGHAFSPIVASGEQACTLHSVDNDAPLRKGDLVVVDVGAEVSHYAADITRTVSVTASPTSRQAEIHQAVLNTQSFAYTQLKPGVIMKEYEEQIAHFMGEQLHRLGLIKSITTTDIRHYFPHATSHFLGLDPHDAGDYTQPLAPGMVLTVEPGIYIPEEKIGVRIEDDIVITETGINVLSERLSTALC